MTEADSPSSDTDVLPTICCDCGTVEVTEAENTEFEVVDDTDELPPDGWYLHLCDAEGISEEGRIQNPDLLLFCPDCKPEEALTTAEAEAYRESGGVADE